MKHNSREVQKIVIVFQTDFHDGFRRYNNDPKCEGAKWEQTNEKCHNDSAQHQNDLFSVFDDALRWD